MTHKDYEAIAEIIKVLLHDEYDKTEVIFANPGDLVKDFCDYFAKNNPRFDRERFMRACGL